MGYGRPGFEGDGLQRISEGEMADVVLDKRSLAVPVSIGLANSAFESGRKDAGRDVTFLCNLRSRAYGCHPGLLLNYRQGEKTSLPFWILVCHRSTVAVLSRSGGLSRGSSYCLALRLICHRLSGADFRRIARAFTPATVEYGPRHRISGKLKAGRACVWVASAEKK
jgi:hypothetical protein